MDAMAWVLLSLIALVAIVLFARLASIEHRVRALTRVDGKLDALLAGAGVDYDPVKGVPAGVIEALQRGSKIEAIRTYRLATGVGLAEAKERVEEIERRRASS